MTREQQRKLNKNTIPTWFNFHVNNRLLEDGDPDYLYYAERIKPSLYLVQWKDDNDKLCNKLYHLNDVLDAVIDCDWLIK